MRSALPLLPGLGPRWGWPRQGENHRRNASQNTKTATAAVRCTFATMVLIDTVFLSGTIQMVAPDIVRYRIEIISLCY